MNTQLLEMAAFSVGKSVGRGSSSTLVAIGTAALGLSGATRMFGPTKIKGVWPSSPTLPQQFDFCAYNPDGISHNGITEEQDVDVK
jgi:hypothetical protein